MSILHLLLAVSITLNASLIILLIFLFRSIRFNSRSLAMRLNAIEQKTDTIKIQHDNNSMSLADIHGMISFVYEECPSSGLRKL